MRVGRLQIMPSFQLAAAKKVAPTYLLKSEYQRAEIKRRPLSKAKYLLHSEFNGTLNELKLEIR